MTLLEKLKTRFDPQIVQPDELAREAHDTIVALVKFIDTITYVESNGTRHNAYEDYVDLNDHMLRAAMAVVPNGDRRFRS